jgi:UDP-N-acetylmuramoyl-L-alanine---L-glutamate ligase
MDERQAVTVADKAAPIIADGATEIAIWGYGREGRATHAYLSAHHPQARVSIVNDGPISGGDDQAVSSAAMLTGEAGIAAIAEGRFALVVKSPGISLYRPEIAAARAKGTLFTSATALWLSRWPQAFTIGISGTKGKSTTASLAHFLFQQAGWRSKLLGNVGVPMLNETPGADVTVLELSSYQIADLSAATLPKMALITNLHPEHAPWHHGHDNYFRDKMRLATADIGIPLAVNAGDMRVAGFISGRPNVTFFDTESGFHVRDGQLRHRETVVQLQALPLRGHHNLVNLAGAFTLLEMAGAYQPGQVWDFLDFEPLPHRLQERRLARGVLAVNDSISTIPETTRAALDVHAAVPFRLLLGGVDRGQDYGELLDHLKTLPTLRKLYLLKGNGGKIATEAAALNLPFAGPFATFEQAVTTALADSLSGETLLLSPGAPSQEEFADFEQRGARFLQLCAVSG